MQCPLSSVQVKDHEGNPEETRKTNGEKGFAKEMSFRS